MDSPLLTSPYRCHGTGYLRALAPGLRCLGCVDCFEGEVDEDVADVPAWPHG